MLTALLTLSLTQLPSPFDFIDNAEIGDAQQYIQLRSRGHYEGQLVDKTKGNTIVSGTWKMNGDTIEVKASGCKGPQCPAVKKDYTAKVVVEAARAMTLTSTAPAPFFPSGSYYCHYLGCEKRHGVEVLSKGANHRVLHVVEDKLIEKNHGRNTTVVWIGERPTTGDGTKSRIETCGREPERAKQALETLKADIAGLDWLGEVTVAETPAKDCNWDVRLYVKDDAQAPIKAKR